MHSAVNSSRAARPDFACICSLPTRQRVATGHIASNRPQVSFKHTHLSTTICKVARLHAGSKRQFSATRLATASEATAFKPLVLDQSPDHALLSRSKLTQQPQASQIRESLRVWGAQNERLKQEQLSDALPFDGKIRTIPNSLFIGAGLENEDAEYQEPLDDGRDDNAVHHSTTGRMFRPGSLMSHSDQFISRQNIVYIGSNGIQSLFLLSDGRWAALKTRQKREAISVLRHYVVPDFLTSEEIELVRQHLPKQVVTRSLDEGCSPNAIDFVGTLPDHVIEMILPKLRDFNLAEQQFLRTHQTQLESMYDNLALEDEWRSINVLDIPPLVFGVTWAEMTDVEKKSFVHYASKAHQLFVGVQTAETLTFHIGPKSMNENVKQVQEWTRLYQEAAARASLGKNVADLLRDNPLSAFIEKARRIITKSRKIRTPTSTGALSPAVESVSKSGMNKVPTGEKFTKNDKKIIQYLWDTSMRRPISRIPVAHSSLIVRAIGAYPSLELGAKTVRMLLKELGCLDPWAESEDLGIPLPHNRTSAEANRLHLKALRSLEAVTNWETKVSHLPDSMEHMRKDWGQLEVLCIDESHSKTFEDGVSVEPASEIEDGYWLRTHFSHPTAHFAIDHPLAEYARKRGTTYFGFDENEPSHPMLPVYTLRQFTLRNNGPCLTVSTLLTKDGRVHDIKVEAGIVRNMQKIDSNLVAKALGGATEEAQESILVVGKLSHIPGYTPDLIQKHEVAPKERSEKVAEFLPQLKLLKQLLTARRLHRLEEVETPAQIPRIFVPGPKLSTHVPEYHIREREFDSYHWTSDPGIIVRAGRTIDMTATHDAHRADDITAQAMRLAAESIGKWLSDRNIPSVFLGNDEPFAFSIKELNESGRHEETEKPVYIRTSYPTPFYDHNMKQYAACSSPLRKYIDMLTHFQIDAYLKAQAQGLIEPGARVQDESILAMSRAGVERYLAVDVYASDSMDDHARQTRGFWIAQALFRAFHFKEAVLPETMEVFVEQPSHRDARGKLQPACGILLPWGLRAILEPSPEGYEKMAKRRQFLPAKLTSIDPNICAASVCATGLPTMESELSGPIRCVTPENILPPESKVVFKSISLE